MVPSQDGDSLLETDLIDQKKTPKKLIREILFKKKKKGAKILNHRIPNLFDLRTGEKKIDKSMNI